MENESIVPIVGNRKIVSDKDLMSFLEKPFNESNFNDEQFSFPDKKCEPKEIAYFDDVDMGT